MKSSFFLVLWGCLFLLWPQLGLARDFQVCSNFASQPVYIAYGYETKEAWVSKGWFMIRPGRCIPFTAPIEGGKFFYFGYSETKNAKYEGDQPFCVDSKPFALKLEDPSAPDCESKGLQVRKFKSFTLESARETRLFLEPPGGAELTALPYAEAEISVLEEWANEGDANAKAELAKRGPRSPAKPKPANSADLQEGPSAAPKDTGAFEVQ